MEVGSAKRWAAEKSEAVPVASKAQTEGTRGE